MSGVVFLFAVAAFVAWIGRHHLNTLAAEGAAEKPQHVHQPTVVADGTVDVCACGERLS